MRWLKHLTNAADDEKLSEVLEIHGAEGYGVYWLIIEKVAAQMVGGSNKTSCRYSANKWAKLCGKNPRGMQKIYATFERLSLFEFKTYGSDKLIISNSYSYDMDTICKPYEYSMDTISISTTKDTNTKLKPNEYYIDINCPNLLKYRDEYSKKSGQHQDNVRRVSGACQEQDTDTDTDTDTEAETDTEEKKERKKEIIKKPDSVSEQTWNDFLTHRKAKKAPVTQAALNRLFSQVKKAGWSIEDALSEIMNRGWTGFSADWVSKEKKRSSMEIYGEDLA